MADLFDGPAGLPATPPPPADTSGRDNLIAARIRAGHALVAARRARLDSPDLPQLKDLLARAESAVQASDSLLTGGRGHTASTPRMNQV